MNNGTFLTGMEFDILTVLMERSGRVVTRDAMMNALKGEDGMFLIGPSMHISHLRKNWGTRPSSKPFVASAVVTP